MSTLQSRALQVSLVALTLTTSWVAMMAVHELGHVIHAQASGGTTERVVLSPLAISRTDVRPNPRPQFVAWGGAIWGSAIPLCILASVHWAAKQFAYLAKFFAGFCCLANGLYLAAGSLTGAGDAGDLMRHGAPQWQLLLVGIPLSILGLWLWNGLGRSFGLGPGNVRIDAKHVAALAAFLTLAVALELIFSPS